jgi:hypothetical protein
MPVAYEAVKKSPGRSLTLAVPKEILGGARAAIFSQPHTLAVLKD